MKNFVEIWKNRGYEKGDMQIFWLQFLRDVLNVSQPENFVNFEVPVKLQHTNFIDAFFPKSKIIVEQKSFNKNIENLSAFRQAQKYISGLPLSMHPTKIIVSNFKEFLIYDMETLDIPKKILLDEIPFRYNEFKFLIEPEINPKVEISLRAGEITKKILKLLTESYKNPSPENKIFANKLCTRFIFCLYADSAGIFKNFQFQNFFNPIITGNRENLEKLFEVLSTPILERDEDLSEIFSNFPYVNGNLFNEKIKIPQISSEIKFYLFTKPADLPHFDWSKINPTIFGSVFESLFTSTNSEKNSTDKKIAQAEEIFRRESGIHFTTVENIHKVIDNLFLNELHEEFISCKKNPEKLQALQEKISQLKFFDPACGSGNFLTETYISLRRLENEILREIGGEIKISINQFYGIEINNFAAELAKLALWISELQMLDETQKILCKKINPLPLKSSANIFNANSLQTDWQKIINYPLSTVNYIFGNPPFVGHQWRNNQQVEDMKIAFHDLDKHGKLDYVCAWYNKAADFINFCDTKIIDDNNLCIAKITDDNNLCIAKITDDNNLCIAKIADKTNLCDTKIECAFVSTNSITQGESVRVLWEFLFAKGIIINFAYRSFKWQSDSTDMAQVHCVVIGFANFSRDKKIIYDGDKKIFAKNINGYLQDAPNFFIENHGNPQKNFPKMTKGSQPTDGGNLILSEDEKNNLLKKFPAAEKFIRRYVGAEEFLHNKKRFCLWLIDAKPAEIKKIPPIYERIKKVAEFRKNSKTKSVREKSETPTIFTQIRQPKNNFLVLPRISSENRKYIPIGFFSPEIIVSNAIQIIPDANLFLFGVLESKVHMIFVKTFCGRLKSDFRYNSAIYNNFPFPDKNFEEISKTAEKILEVRRKYFESSLAELYDENLMPVELRDAHRKNDLAVMAAYNFDKNLSDEEILRELINLRKNLTEK